MGLLARIGKGAKDATLGVSRSSRPLTPREQAIHNGEVALTLVGAFEDHGTGWFWQTDRHGRLTYLSGKVAREFDGGAGVLGTPLTALFQVDDAAHEHERTLTFHLSSRTAFSDYSVRPASGDRERWWSISGRPMFDGFGHFQGFVGSGSDLTEQRRSEAEITRLALYDWLTGLANRQRIKLALDQTLAQSATQSYRPTALLMLDLDRFKAVNDTLGHQTGDALLKQVGQRLARSVSDAGLVARVGGDEFKVMLPGEDNRERIADLSRSIIESLSQPYFIGGSSITIGCSIGVAIAPDDGRDAEMLVRNADLALYAAKADGRGVHRFFEAEMLAEAQERRLLEDDLRVALHHDQLHVAYQPVVSTHTARIVGYEALVRWEHPVRGAISPTVFIPIAEDSGLIEPIGEWVLRTATAEAASWPEHIRVAVNVSPIQFANPALPAIVANVLAKSGIAPARLELEITEGVFLNDNIASETMFRQLKGLGVRLALDDFGTGYSSLGYLRKAPFDKIKIDQSFVRGAAVAGNRNAAIIKAIVALAETLEMETTAEGVEMQDEIELIRGLGCSHIQGYVYGRPIRCDAVMAQLAEGGEGAATSGYRTSRSPRLKMLRWARLEVGGDSGDVRIRNLSVSGAMIDGIEFPPSAVGMAMRIELVEGHLFEASLRWARGGQAGLRFDRPFNMDWLNNPPRTNAIRRVA